MLNVNKNQNFNILEYASFGVGVGGRFGSVS